MGKNQTRKSSKWSVCKYCYAHGYAHGDERSPSSSAVTQGFEALKQGPFFRYDEIYLGDHHARDCPIGNDIAWMDDEECPCVKPRLSDEPCDICQSGVDRDRFYVDVYKTKYWN